MSLTASSVACSQTLADSIKRNIIEIGMRYDSLTRAYDAVLVELEQREREIQQLHRVLDLEKADYQLQLSEMQDKYTVANDARLKAVAIIQRQQKKRFVVGPGVNYGVHDQGLGMSVGINLTYKLISF